MLELPCGFPVRFVGLIDLHVCDSESDEGENDRKDGQQDADLIEVAVDSLRPPVCGFLFRLVPHAVVRAADAVQPFLSRQFWRPSSLRPSTWDRTWRLSFSRPFYP